MVKRMAEARWEGGLKDGKGVVSTERGVLKETPYNFSGRFEESTAGTNPEELIGAALAGCFSMAFSGQLDKGGIQSESVTTKAVVTFEKTEPGMTITNIHLDTRVRAPGADRGAVETAGKNAKEGCPISRLLSPGTSITLDLTIET